MGLSGTFNTQLGHLVHEFGRELIVALKSEQLVLEVGLVEEDDVQGDRVYLIDGPYFTDDPGLVIALVLDDKLQHTSFKFLDEYAGRAES